MPGIRVWRAFILNGISSSARNDQAELLIEGNTSEAYDRSLPVPIAFVDERNGKR